MNFLKLFPVLLVCTLSVVFAIVSCNTDPWSHGGNPKDTDNVVIKKITKKGTQKDGVSPYKGQVGAVTMSHSVHEKAGVDCIVCHHKENNDARVKECAQCHYGDEGFDVMHGLCVDCHIGRKKGPQKCMECH